MLELLTYLITFFTVTVMRYHDNYMPYPLDLCRTKYDYSIDQKRKILFIIKYSYYNYC